MAVDASGRLPEPAGYAELLEQLEARVRTSQVRAARAADSELLQLYWSAVLRIATRHGRTSPQLVEGGRDGLRVSSGGVGLSWLRERWTSKRLRSPRW